MEIGEDGFVVVVVLSEVEIIRVNVEEEDSV